MARGRDQNKARPSVRTLKTEKMIYYLFFTTVVYGCVQRPGLGINAIPDRGIGRLQDKMLCKGAYFIPENYVQKFTLQKENICDSFW